MFSKRLNLTKIHYCLEQAAFVIMQVCGPKTKGKIGPFI